MRAWERVLLVVGLWVGLLAPGCATRRFEPVPVRPAAEYPGSVTEGRLRVAAEAITEAGASRRHFGVHLRSLDVLPVLIVVENDDPERSFLLRPEWVVLVGTAPIARAGSGSAAGGDGPSRSASTARRDTPALEGRAAEIRHNLLATSLHASTVSPGERVSGVVHFQLARPLRGGEPVAIEVALLDLATQEERRLRLSLAVD
jgi:hypothetical protein